MQLFVPDASILLKWVISGQDEAYVDKALHLREMFQAGEILLAVPSLWRFEVGNTLARKFPATALRQLSHLQQLGMQEPEPDRAWLVRTIALTRDYGVTFYDAAYHSIALTLGGILLSADCRYLNAAASAGSALHIRDWSM